MGKIDQVNELLHRELAAIVNREVEMPDCLITVIEVRTAENLRDANVRVSVLPEGKSGTALRALKRRSGAIGKAMAKVIRLRQVPKLTWKLDAVSRHAAEMDRTFEELRSKETI